MAKWIGVAVLLVVAAGVLALLPSMTTMRALSDDETATLRHDDSYDIEPLAAPSLTGRPLRFLAWLVARSPVGPLLSRYLLNVNGPHRLRELATRYGDAPLTLWPVRPLSAGDYAQHEQLAAASDAELSAHDARPLDCSEAARRQLAAARADSYWTVEDYAQHYRCGWTTPSAVAARLLAALGEESDGPLARLRLFSQLRPELTMAAAQASDRRHAAGQPLGVFDGVPVAVKDEIDVRGWATTYGSDPAAVTGAAQRDDLLVARLLAAGMVIVGKTTLSEYGTSPIGHNPRWGGAFNPHNDSYLTGGSSGGSAGAVAAGVVPYAVGFDGGGSIRIPSATCGVVGLAATFSRIPFDGAGPRFSTVHTGPIAATPRDAARVYRLLAAVEPGHYATDVYANGAVPPPPPHLARRPLAGLRVGVFWPHFDDCAEPVRSLAAAAVRALVDVGGARLVNVTIPHLSALSLAHALTIAAEFGLLHDRQYGAGWAYEPQSLITLAVGRSLAGVELQAAAAAKGWAIAYFQRLFADVDVVVSPTTADPELFRYRAAMASDGESDTVRMVNAMKYIFLTNLLGYPGLTVPVGHHPHSAMPVGLHLMGRYWDDATLLSIAADIFELTRPARRRPAVFFDALAPHQGVVDTQQ